MATLEQDEYALLHKQMEYDKECYHGWQLKYTRHTDAVYHKQRDWRISCLDQVRELVEKYMHFQVKLGVWDDSMDLINEIQSCPKKASQRLQIEKQHLYNAPLLN